MNKAMKAKEFVEDKYEDLSRLNCLMYDDLTFFDIRALEAGNKYDVLGTYHFNFCRILKDSSSGEKTFAYTDVSTFLDSSTKLTGGDKPSVVTAVHDPKSADNTRHLYFEIDGGDECTNE